MVHPKCTRIESGRLTSHLFPQCFPLRLLFERYCIPSTSLYSELLVNPSHASFQLTLVCLECIRISCIQSLVRLVSDTHRIDLKINPKVLVEHGLANPMSEYAIFAWMTHLIDCEAENHVDVVRAFQDTFGSCSNFCWVETCMVC